MFRPFFALLAAAVLLTACVNERGDDAWRPPYAERTPDGFRQYQAPYQQVGSCEPADALARGRQAGLRSPAVRQVTPDRVVVGDGGGDDGYSRPLILQNRPGCPYLRY